MPTTTHRYGSGPNYVELGAIVAIGALHVVVELASTEKVAFLYTGVVALVVLGYLTWRIRISPEALRVWGMRTDNFQPALMAQLPFAVVGVVVLVSYGVAMGSLVLPWTFWFTVALYPIWGTAQQFALQNLVARNLTELLTHPTAIAAAAAALFSVSHYPRTPLVLLTLGSGFFFTLAYRRAPNLWAVGTVHGVLGSLAVYIVLQEDPGAAIWGFLVNVVN